MKAIELKHIRRLSILLNVCVHQVAAWDYVIIEVHLNFDNFDDQIKLN